MGILSNLEPKRVFEIFEEMCAIPHGSANTKAISDWCVAFGEKLGLEHYQDEANNVLLIAPATPGYEDAPAVILRAMWTWYAKRRRTAPRIWTRRAWTSLWTAIW